MFLQKLNEQLENIQKILDKNDAAQMFVQKCWENLDDENKYAFEIVVNFLH